MSLLSQITAVRQNAGIWLRRDHTLLRFFGKDAGAWLHNQTTNDVLALQSGQGNRQALVNRQGRLQCVFYLFRFEEEYWAIIEKAQVGALQERYDTHRFLEAVEWEDVAGAGQVMVEGPRAALFLLHYLDPQPSLGDPGLPSDSCTFSPVTLSGYDLLAFRITESGEDGYLLVPAPGQEELVYETLAAEAGIFGIPEVEESAGATLLIESGQPRYLRDWDTETVIAETPFERDAVSYSKGCYLGQEVVTRLKTYGTPKQALAGLLIEGDAPELPPQGQALFVNGIRAGKLCAYTWSPTLQQWIALAYLDREHRTEGEQYHFSGEAANVGFDGAIKHLPLYEPRSREDYARRLYEEALRHFEQDHDDTDDTSIGLLEDAIRLSPRFEDAYETLGVILHRHHRVDEAIEIMQRLAAMNPNCVMAHTNLSVFYVSKGLIQEAEEEKALAGQLEFKQQLDARQAAKEAEHERERIRAEARERIGMFREVLDIDPDDPVATMGMGTAYMQLEQYSEAIPFLQSATRLQKDYSAAWLQLGKAHEFNGDGASAVEAYREGIAAAGRKGDLMPMREMERRLKALGGIAG